MLAVACCLVGQMVADGLLLNERYGPEVARAANRRTVAELQAYLNNAAGRATVKDLQRYTKTRPIPVEPNVQRWRLSDGAVETVTRRRPDGQLEVTCWGPPPAPPGQP